MRNFTKLFTLLLMAAMSMGMMAAAVSIPTTLGSYMDFDDAVLANCNSEYDGLSVGSTRSNTVITFTLANAAEQEYYLKMRTAAKDLTGVLTITVKNGDEALFTTDRDIENTGSWYLADDKNPTYHTFSMGTLPAGTLSLEIKVKSTTGSYAGNYGYLAIHGANQYDQIPGETALDIEHGTHGGNGTPRWHEGTKIAYIYNGGYSIYNVYANPSAYSNPEKIYLNMKMDVVSFNHVGQFQVSIYDVNDLTTPECQQTFDITKKANDQVFAFTNPITPGFKQIRFDYILDGDTYMCDYNNLRFAERDDEAGDDPSAATFGLSRAVANEPNGDSKYEVEDVALIDPSATGVTLSKDYGAGLTGGSGTSYHWYDGGQKECYINTGNRYRTSSNTISETAYFGIQMEVAVGKKISLQRIISDAFKEDNGGLNGLYYQVKIYQNGSCIKTLDNVNVLSSASAKRSIDISRDEALQGLTGAIAVRMHIWNAVEPHYARHMDVKDLRIKAIVEDNDEEGETGITLVKQQEETWVLNNTGGTAKVPEYTEGNVILTIQRGDGYNVAADGSGRGIRITENMQMAISVPENSYISEVVFVNNGQGNPNAEGNSFNMTISSQNGKTVSSFAEPKTGNEHTWSCGVVRESELVFTQGTGDFYCKSIRVTYMEKGSRYTRVHPHGNLNTLCYPYEVSYYTGATFYTMLYKVEEASAVTDVYLQEHVGALEAGKPYFYVPEGDELVCYYSGAREDTPAKVNGVQGFYENLTTIPSGSYVAYNNLLTVVGENVRMGEYRAYVVMDDVADKDDPGAPALVPGRRLLNIGGHKTPTGVENTSAAAIYGGSQKILRNGQIVIVKGDKMYNMLGQEL